MKTLVITGAAGLPAPVREVVERGSTSVVEKHAAEVGAARLPDADRVVLWAAPGDAQVAHLARAYARHTSPEHKDTLIIIAPESSGPLPGVPTTELFMWPRDEDRLKMAFMTGA